MKTLITLFALVGFTHTASALSVSEIEKTFADPGIQEAFKDLRIDSVSQGPSFKCLGCFGIKVETVNNKGVFEIHWLRGSTAFNEFKVEIYDSEVVP